MFAEPSRQRQPIGAGRAAGKRKAVGMTETWYAELVHERRGRVTRQMLHVNRHDDEALRLWLIELAVEHALERRERVSEWIGQYALHLCWGCRLRRSAGSGWCGNDGPPT